jgi:hypothetical protein
MTPCPGTPSLQSSCPDISGIHEPDDAMPRDTVTAVFVSGHLRYIHEPVDAMPGDTVTAVFVSGHLRYIHEPVDAMPGDTFTAVFVSGHLRYTVQLKDKPTRLVNSGGYKEM